MKKLLSSLSLLAAFAFNSSYAMHPNVSSCSEADALFERPLQCTEVSTPAELASAKQNCSLKNGCRIIINPGVYSGLSVLGFNSTRFVHFIGVRDSQGECPTLQVSGQAAITLKGNTEEYGQAAIVHCLTLESANGQGVDFSGKRLPQLVWLDHVVIQDTGSRSLMYSPSPPANNRGGALYLTNTKMHDNRSYHQWLVAAIDIFYVNNSEIHSPVFRKPQTYVIPRYMALLNSRFSNSGDNGPASWHFRLGSCGTALIANNLFDMNYEFGAKTPIIKRDLSVPAEFCGPDPSTNYPGFYLINNEVRADIAPNYGYMPVFVSPADGVSFSGNVLPDNVWFTSFDRIEPVATGPLPAASENIHPDLTMPTVNGFIARVFDNTPPPDVEPPPPPPPPPPPSEGDCIFDSSMEVADVVCTVRAPSYPTLGTHPRFYILNAFKVPFSIGKSTGIIRVKKSLANAKTSYDIIVSYRDTYGVPSEKFTVVAVREN